MIKIKDITERDNYGQNRYVRISILDNDVCMIMKYNENDEVSKCSKCSNFYPNQHCHTFFKGA